MSDLAAAPGGLRFVQSLVNTSGGHRPDLLQDVGEARGWLAGALAAWSAATSLAAPAVELDEGDLTPLRDHRELLRQTLRARLDPAAGPRPSQQATARILLSSGPGGVVSYEPFESGWRAVRGLTSAETLLAQARGHWPRLKVCARPPCGACFYDASPNRSRVWHDTRTCGNITRLRASRARRRG